jgi:hypothetical protein
MFRKLTLAVVLVAQSVSANTPTNTTLLTDINVISQHWGM